MIDHVGFSVRTAAAAAAAFSPLDLSRSGLFLRRMIEKGRLPQ
jgi:hypothetical protein